MTNFCFSLDSTIPFLFIISLSFYNNNNNYYYYYFCVRDVVGLCGFVRFEEVFHNFRDPITQRYESFPFFFVYGLLQYC